MKDRCEIISWQEAIPQLEQINPKLSVLIKNLELNNNHKFIKVKYNFGEEIFKNGVLNIPINDQLKPISAQEVPTSIKDALKYHHIPLGVSINKILEGYLKNKNGVIIPHSIYNPGGLIGTITNLSKKEFISDEKYWSLTAGNRSLYLLPKISDDRSYNRLKKEFNFDIPKPTGLTHQHQIFKCISESAISQDYWQAEVYFFSEEWFNESNSSYLDFQLYLYQEAWERTKAQRQTQYFHYEISNILDDSYLKPNPYVLDILYYLHNITEGDRAGFFITNTDRSGPIKLLQDVFVDVYKLNKIPIFIEANYFGATPSLSVYFSFALQTLIRYTPKSRKTSRIVEIEELYDLIQRIKNYKKFEPKETYCAIDQWYANFDFQFFHMETVNSGNDFLNPSETLLKVDRNISDYLDKYPNLEFSTTDAFFRGCIKMSIK